MDDDKPEDTPNPGHFSFFKGAEDVIALKMGKGPNWDQSAAKVRENLADALSARHVAFLLGSGCSSYLKDGQQVGIPTMGPLASAFTSTVGNASEDNLASAEERDYLSDRFGIDVTAPAYTENLEALMEVLLSLQFVLKRSASKELQEALVHIQSFISKITRFIFGACTAGPFTASDDTVISLYQTFYRKLSYRDRALPRPWIFTTNYDLFNETAMDRLGVPYSNGFSGTVERRFNPANFRYSLGEQLDISSRKWTAAESFVYLCKLHGSVNWVEESKGLFPIREIQSPSATSGRLMIYPTPAKQSASFGSPYADLFREFQSRVVREQSVLFVIGYSFGDEHVNNIIFQALTVPSFRMVAFIAPESRGVKKQLLTLADPRIWLVGGDGPSSGRKAHYFDTFVEHFMPEPPGDKVDRAVTKVLETLLGKRATDDARDVDDI